MADRCASNALESSVEVSNSNEFSDVESAVRLQWRKELPNVITKNKHALVARTFDEDEVVEMVSTILSGQLTMSSRVKEFEHTFAKKVSAPYAVMVNSGSSANLLTFAALVNPGQRNPCFVPGDEVLVPAVCWSTSVAPIVQMGLVPVFVDADPTTLNISVEDLKCKITKRSRAVLLVHVLGLCTDMKKVMEVAQTYNLTILEDTCESLGSKSYGQTLGTFGRFGMFSFYYSHHITTGEGGMIVCHTQEDADLLKCLRAHGWTRELSDKEDRHAQAPDIDPRFCFVNLGYNVRPMEIQAAMGLCQLRKLDMMNSARCQNYTNLTHALKSHTRFANQFQFVTPAPGCDPAWFGFSCLLDKRIQHQSRAYLRYLDSCGVENRPIISGNMLRQPLMKIINVHSKPEDFPGAEEIHHRGFFIGVHIDVLTEKAISELADILLSFDFGV